MRYEGEKWRLDLPLPSLPGTHQIANAGIAMACLERLDGFLLPEEAIAAGLRHIDWPARLHRLTSGPLAEILPSGWELWLDGGHNPGAGQVLAEMAAGWRDRPLYLVVGMLNTKDASGFLTPLQAHARALCTLTIPGEENALPAARIAATARALGIRAEETASVETALRSIVARAIVNREAGPARVLICGSLHLAGIVLAENG
jgi:dihydrofolate synthase/folylpolyglutamate synthase